MGFLQFLLVSLVDGKTLYALDDGGVNISHNNGESWEFHSLDMPPTAWSLVGNISTDPKSGNIAYVVANGRLFVTPDAGDSWVVPSFLANVVVNEVVTDRKVNNLAYAVTENSAIFRTTNGGAAWGLIADLSEYQYATPVKTMFAQDGMLLAVGHWPENVEDRCSNAFLVSEDEGLSWESLRPPIFSCFETYPYNMVSEPEDGNIIYASVEMRDGYRSIIKSENRGETWNFQYPLDRAFKIVSNSEGSVLYAIESYQVSKSNNHGDTWISVIDQSSSPNTLFFDGVQNPQDINNAYLATIDNTPFQQGVEILKTTDAGVSWQSIFQGEYPYRYLYMNDIAIDPNDPSRLFTGHPNFMSSDAGSSISSWAPDIDEYLYTIAFNPLEPQHMLLGLAGHGGGLYFSPDGGKTITIRGLSSDFKIFSIAFEPNDSQIVYVVAGVDNSVQLYKSSDEGVSWESVSDLTQLGYEVSPLRDWAARVSYLGNLLIHPDHPNTMFFARGEIFMSVDAGKTWNPIMQGIPPGEEVSDMIIAKGDSVTLYAAGISGIWRLELKE